MSKYDPDQHITDSSFSALLTPVLLLVFSLSSAQPPDYEIPDRRGMSVKWTAEMRKSKPFIGTTTHEATFVKPEVGVDDAI
jgi:hypothetical protein